MPAKPKRVTRGSANKKQCQVIQSLATGSSPPKGTRTKKSTEKQAKSCGESSSDGNSTGDENTSVAKKSIAKKQVSSSEENAPNDGTETNASVTMTTPFDAKLAHVLTNYLSAAGADHHIRKAFIHKDILTFEDFTDVCTVENIKTFQRDDGNNILVQAFSNTKLTLITNVRLY